VFFSAIVRIFPGYGALNATRPVVAVHLKNVRNRLSPARHFRLRPPKCRRHARVHFDAVGHVVIAPAGAKSPDPGNATACMSSPMISWVIAREP
jgi:hypothetical protein